MEILSIINMITSIMIIITTIIVWKKGKRISTLNTISTVITLMIMKATPATAMENISITITGVMIIMDTAITIMVIWSVISRKGFIYPWFHNSYSDFITDDPGFYRC